MEISSRAYCKLILHCGKYPSSQINGLLLARKDDLSHICDAIPLFHMSVGLTPMHEVALSQVENEAVESGLVVAGFYHAHENIRDNHIDVFSQKIGDKIAENQSGAVIITVDSKRLSANIDNPGLILHQHVDGKWKLKDKVEVKLEHEEATLECASELVERKVYRELVDFDNHLDDIGLDYLNVQLNMKIDACLDDCNGSS